MKKFTYILTALLTMTLMGCKTNQESKVPVELPEYNADIVKIASFFTDQSFYSIADAIEFSENFLLQDVYLPSRSSDETPVNISAEALSAIEKMQNVSVDTDNSPDMYRLELFKILNNSKLSKGSTEYQALSVAIDATIYAINYKMSLEKPDGMTRGFWSDAWSVVKCVGGTIGSAGLGAIAGAGVGTVTLPVVGTVSGTALGGYSGALVGVATFC